MKFGIFYEHQLPRPWEEDSELTLIQHALEQCELADQLGIDYVWEVEHHFLEEYSHSSAPEVFLATPRGPSPNPTLRAPQLYQLLWRFERCWWRLMCWAGRREETGTLTA